MGKYAMKNMWTYVMYRVRWSIILSISCFYRNESIGQQILDTHWTWEWPEAANVVDREDVAREGSENQNIVNGEFEAIDFNAGINAEWHE